MTPETDGRGWREAALVGAASAAATAALTYPLAFRLGSVGRVDQADGQFSIWNVAWVARTLIADPRHLFDANIFYPHTGTLAYSEANIGAGLVAAPIYWLTRNPYAAHNAAVLVSFVLAAAGMYYLVRYLAGDRRAAAVSALCFAFCPHIFAHLAQVQALMTLWIPFAMLAFHRLVDRPTLGRGAALGAAMAAEALWSGYYGVFVLLMVGFAAIVCAGTRRLWRDHRYWSGLAAGALVAGLIVGPFYLPFADLRSRGFTRTLEDAGHYAANWSSYAASAATAHAWLLQYLPRWSDVNFPGIVATLFGAGAVFLVRTRRDRETVAIYGGLTALSFWASFGPRAGLYSALYAAVPPFAWLRVPSRFGLVVAFGLAVLAALGIRRLLQASRHATLVGAALAIVTCAELRVPLRLPDAIPVAPVYRTLATLPPGPVIETPFYYPQVGLYQHAKYMLASTAHWMPLVNGYSDYVPSDFYEHVMTLAPFPSRDAFKILEPGRVRYAIIHLNGYNAENRHDVMKRLEEFSAHLRPLYQDDATRLYEIVSFPP
ncbi:MAG: hypothetical protein IT176_05960 [Acidobacteria bacterium]|nr:hypothetical protein [Acidobacteriota bacterium]